LSKPIIHAKSSAKKYGGTPEDYLGIHTFMDESKGALGDNRHRVLTHQAGFLVDVLVPVYGEVFVRSSDGKVMSTRDIGEQHCGEDYHGFIPTVEDYLSLVPLEGWMTEDHGTPAQIVPTLAAEDISLRLFKAVDRVLSYTPEHFMQDLRLIWKGIDEDDERKLMKIIDLMDYGRKYYSDIRYRALTHNTWFVSHVVPRAFRGKLYLSTGAFCMPEQIARLYVEMQFGRVPSPQAWFENMPMTGWMNNGRGEPPASYKGLLSNRKTTVIKFDTD
jgi:hypothetical protein